METWAKVKSVEEIYRSYVDEGYELSVALELTRLEVMSERNFILQNIDHQIILALKKVFRNEVININTDG